MTAEPRFSRRHGALLGLLAALVALLATASLLLGPAPLDVPAALADVLSGRDTLGALVLADLRLPRAALGLTVGFSLGITGAALQGFLRNPLADPGIIGVSGAAAFGAVVVFYSGLAGVAALALPLGGIAGAAVATALIYALGGRASGTAALILAGVALNSLGGALTALALNLSPNPYAVTEIVFWLMGSFSDRNPDAVALVVPMMAAGWLVLLATARGLDALTLGEETAASLGFSLRRVRALVIAGSALCVGAAVAVAGSIGFVGLVVPHLMRPLTGHRPGRLLVASGLAGAALTLASDLLVRLIPVQPELKIGVVTALVGAPFLIALIGRGPARF
ncbi:iron ABC transporter permease [Pseudoxanthobacter sp.]|uniref:FecCD family ABC transporter permease n=1 Tax=Pseudoxanthobacter sp. TaxID=1925742 RepID=UPI002FE0EADD